MLKKKSPRRQRGGGGPQRMGTGWLWLVCAVGWGQGGSGVAVGQEPGAVEFRRQIFAWVHQLEAGDPATQAGAEQALRNAGLAALPLLTNVDFGLQSDTARATLERLRADLLAERLRHEQEPTRVTVMGTLSARQALDALGRQATVTIRGAEQSTQPLEFRLQQVEFWRAWDSILNAGRLELYPYGGTPGVLQVISAQDPPQTPSSAIAYQGPYRLAIEQTTATRDSAHPALDQLLVTLSVQWEPRIKILAVRQPLANLQATWSAEGSGEAGLEKLRAKNPEQTAEAAVQSGQVRAELPLRLQLPPRRAARLERVQGSLQVLVAGPPESFAFANLELAEKNLVRDRGSTSLRLLEWQTTSEGYVVDLELQVNNEDAVESFRSWPSECQVELDLGMGLAVPPARQEILRQSAGGVAVRCLFTQDPSGMTLRFAAPLAVVPQTINFELRGIILP